MLKPCIGEIRREKKLEGERECVCVFERESARECVRVKEIEKRSVTKDGKVLKMVLLKRASIYAAAILI